MLNLFKGRLQILPTNARAGSLPLWAEESGELGPGIRRDAIRRHPGFSELSE
jgi:hypothetical protein